jgi:hypothetical protein
MSWADDTAQPYAGKETILARRERPQILLKGEAGMVRKTPFWEHFIVLGMHKNDHFAKIGSGQT